MKKPSARRKVKRNSELPFSTRFVASIVSLIVMLIAISAVVGNIGLHRLITNKAQIRNALFVRISKNYIAPGENFTIYVYVSKLPYRGYTGFVDAEVVRCDAAGANCVTTEESLWKDFSGNTVQINNGTIDINVPPSTTAGTYTIRFKPNPNPANLEYSNLLKFSIGTTTNLFDFSQYFKMPTNVETVFVGNNFSYGGTNFFKTVVGFDASQAQCGGLAGQNMYFIKNKPEGFPNPKLPWYDTSRPEGYYMINPLFHNIGFTRQSGFHDEYLYTWGVEQFDLNLTQTLTRGNNFQTKKEQTRYGSQMSGFPPHILVPKWVGIGWGIDNKQATHTNRDANTSFCSIPGDEQNSFWSANIDVIFLSGYGNVLRLKYYEGPRSFLDDEAQGGRREDWFFSPNEGLVRVDVKYFCPSSWGSFANCLPCTVDHDCTVNEFMVLPHITLQKAGTTPPGPEAYTEVSLAANPASPGTYEPVDLTAQVTGTSTGTIRYRFDCTNDGTWDHDFTTSQTNYTATDVCTYNTQGIKTAEVRVDRGGSFASDTILIEVTGCNKQGDANNDCFVDGFDYVIWWQNFGQNVSGGPSQGDFDTNGFVDGFDYVVWWLNFGT